MSTQRIIQCVGTTEEDTAHLRLLLRVARTHVRDSWTWGTESRADLVIVDTRRLIGDSAMRRAAQRGIACAPIIEANDPKPAGLFLRKPFRREAFATLLNKAGRGTAVGPEIDTWSDEFSELDLGQVDLSQLEAAHPGVPGGPARRGKAGDTHAEGESLDSADATSDLSGMLIAHKHDENAENDVEGIAAADEASNADGSAIHAEDGFDPPFESDPEPEIDQDATYPLIYFLQKGLLEGPSQITLRGAPTLMIDPEEQLFWAKGLLPALEPYAREPLRFGDWKLLKTRSELEEARRGSAAKPFARLIWMDSFIHSNGFLSKHFDPGGDYRLTKRIDLSLDYPRAYRVGSLMTVPRKLHEIARVSAVGLAEVFDVINAYEAIGYVEWTPRVRTPR